MKRRLVSMILAVSMVLPVLSPIVQAEEVWHCGKEAHRHIEACWEQGYVCGKEGDAEHAHEDGCFTLQQNLSCTQQENHSHGENCYGEDGAIICDLEEAHNHGEGCYTQEEALICQFPETHAHEGACYEAQQILTCEIHVHDDSCMGEVLVCEWEEHTHGDACKCTCETLCTADSIKADCGICSAENVDLTKCQGVAPELCSHGEEKDQCVLCALEELIDTLPTYEAMGQLDGNAQTAAIEAVAQAQQDYYALTEGEQGQVSNRDKLLAILEAPEDQPVTVEDTIPQAAVPTGLEWGVRCRRVYNNGIENPTIVQESFPGSIKWEAGDPALKEYQVAVYQNGNSQPVYRNSYNGYGTPFSDTDFVRFYLPELGSGQYYFTITTLGDDVTYRDSETVQSAIWEYSEPVDALPAPTNQTVTAGDGVVIYTSDMPRSEYMDGYRLESQFSVTGDFENSVSSQTRTMSQEQDPNDPRNYVLTSNFPVEDVGGYYRFRAKAISNNLSVIKDSEWSDYTTPFCYPSVSSEDKCGDNLTWKYENGVLTISGTGAMYNYGDPFVSAESSNAPPWDQYSFSIKSIAIESGVTSIGDFAFNGVDAEMVTLPDSITSIGEAAFEYCYYLTSVTLPKNLTSLGERAFNTCSRLSSVTIPEKLTTINMYAFASTALNSITIPTSVESMAVHAFYNCKSLTEIKFLGDAPSATVNPAGSGVFDGVTATAYYPGGNTTWTEAAKDSFGGTITWVASEPPVSTENKCGDNLLWKLENGVLTIYGTGDMHHYLLNNAYGENSQAPWYDQNAQINSIVIETGATSIGNYAFYGCAAQSVSIAGTVTTIGSDAFGSCKNLASVTIPGSVKLVDVGAFRNCSALSSLTISDGVTRIWNSAFYRCTSLSALTIPASVTHMGSYAFEGCSGLKNITFLGDCPTNPPVGNTSYAAPSNVFSGVTANGYYPTGNTTWTSENWTVLGGTINWQSSGSGETATFGFTFDKSKMYYTGDDITFAVTAPGAEKVQLVVDGYELEITDITNGTATVIRSFSQSGENRKIQFKQCINGVWSEPCEAQYLSIFAYAPLAKPEPAVENTPCYLNQPVTVSWNQVPYAEQYRVIVGNGSNQNILDTVVSQPVSGKVSVTIPGDKLTVVGNYTVQVIATGLKYDQSEGAVLFALEEDPTLLAQINSVTLSVPDGAEIEKAEGLEIVVTVDANKNTGSAQIYIGGESIALYKEIVSDNGNHIFYFKTRLGGENQSYAGTYTIQANALRKENGAVDDTASLNPLIIEHDWKYIEGNATEHPHLQKCQVCGETNRQKNEDCEKCNGLQENDSVPVKKEEIGEGDQKETVIRLDVKIDPYEIITPRYYVPPGEITSNPEYLAQIIQQFNVLENYMPAGNNFCNTYLSNVARAMGAFLPLSKDTMCMNQDCGKVISVSNDYSGMTDYLQEHGLICTCTTPKKSTAFCFNSANKGSWDLVGTGTNGDLTRWLLEHGAEFGWEAIAQDVTAENYPGTRTQTELNTGVKTATQYVNDGYLVIGVYSDWLKVNSDGSTGAGHGFVGFPNEDESKLYTAQAGSSGAVRENRPNADNDKDTRSSANKYIVYFVYKGLD